MPHENRIRRRFLSAVKRGDLATARTLLARGADVNATVSRRAWQAKTALMRAAEAGDEEMARLLLQHGADLHLWTADKGMTALMFAAARGHARIVQFLLEHGADLVGLAGDGSTVLMLAVEGEHLEVVKLLLSAGVDVHARRRWNFSGRTALSIASAKLNEASQAVRFLEASWETGKDLTAARKLERRYTELVRLLREAGATE
jgi:ankyrin repeat protein